MKKIVLSIVAVMLSFMIMGCSDYSINGGSFNTGWTPEDIPDDPVTPTPTPETAEKAPLYWTVYEYGRLAEKNGTDCNMPKEIWQKNIDWKTVADYGMGFAILRITEAGNVTDNYFEKNYAACQEYNIPTGVYK